MQIPQKEPSMIGRSLNWMANHTYRKITSIINSYKKKPLPSKKLSFQDYINQPQLAREAGLRSVQQQRKDYSSHKQGIQRVIYEFKSNGQQMKQNPHELICAICFELFSGPVTTSCYHTFCRMCIDESILFNPNCPTCRNNIRGQQLIVSKATEAIIRMILYKLQIGEVQRFVKKQLEYQEWLEKRTPKRQELQRGQLIDVRDTENIWCKASIIEMLPVSVSDPSKYEYVLVHYEGWASRFDEVIPLNSMRLATRGFYMSRYQIPHYNLDPNNPQHYRCPVVTGPPQPIAQVIAEQPIIESDSDSSISSSDDNQIVFIDEDEDEEVIQNQSAIQRDHSLSSEQIRLQPGDGQYLHDLYDGERVGESDDSSSQSEIVQHYSLYDHQLIRSNSERNDNHILQQQRHNLSCQQAQLQRDVQETTFYRPYHCRSLPQERTLDDLIQSDFGQMLYENGYLQDGERRQVHNSQVDERIFREVNQQMQLACQDSVVYACTFGIGFQNPQQKSMEKVQLSNNKMNEIEFQIKQQDQQLLQRENENEVENDRGQISS